MALYSLRALTGQASLPERRAWKIRGDTSGSKAISCEKYTHLTGLFVRLLRCSTSCIHAVVADGQKSCAIWVYLFLAIA